MTALSDDAYGHIDIKAGATVYEVEQTTSANTKISVDANATVYDKDGSLVTSAVVDDTTRFSSNNEGNKETVSASECDHNGSLATIVIDSEHVYQVCKECGYTLISVNGVKKTVRDGKGDNVIIPMASYDSTQLASGSSAANDGTNGEIVLIADSSTETGYVAPSIESTPTVSGGNNATCTHESLTTSYDYHDYEDHLTINTVCDNCGANFSQDIDYWTKHAATAYSTPIDENNKVVTINSAEELALFTKQIKNDFNVAKGEKYNQFKGYTVKLTADIDLGQYAWIPINMSCDSYNGQGFAGTFDGQNHIISSLYCICRQNAGLFGSIGISAGNSPVKNLVMNNANIIAENHAGVIAGTMLCGAIDNCHVYDSKVTAKYNITKKADGSYDYDDGDKVGGLVGYFTCEPTGYIDNCSMNNVTVTGYRDLGGIVGYAGWYSGTKKSTSYIRNCDVKGLKVINDRAHDYKGYGTTDGYDVGEIVGDSHSNDYQPITDHIDMSNNTFDNASITVINQN